MNPSASDPTVLARAIDRLRATVVVLAAGLGLLVAQQFTPRPQLEAQRFVLRDSGRVFRGALEMRDDGGAAIRLNDADSRPRLYALVMPDGRPRVRLTDAAGHHRLQAEVDAVERVHLDFADSAGRSRLHVRLDASGEPLITWRDSLGAHALAWPPGAPSTKRPARR